MEHQAVVLHLTLDQLDYGMAHGHGQPHWHNERLPQRLAAIDGHGRLGEDLFLRHTGSPSNGQATLEVWMELMLLLGAVLALGNIVASVAVLRVSVLSPSQRALQVALIWLVPVIGAVVCAAFASSQAAGSTSSGTSDPFYLSSDGGVSGGQDAGFSGCDAGDSGCAGSSD